MRNSFTIERTIKAPIERVFDAFITPEDLVQWHHAGDGWSTPYAEVDARAGGLLKIGYADEKGVTQFDLIATFEEVTRPSRIAYRLQLEEMIKHDARLVTIDFSEVEGATHIVMEVDLEELHSVDLQRKGWTEHVEHLEQMLAAEHSEQE